MATLPGQILASSLDILESEGKMDDAGKEELMDNWSWTVGEMLEHGGRENCTRLSEKFIKAEKISKVKTYILGNYNNDNIWQSLYSESTRTPKSALFTLINLADSRAV